MAYFTSPNAQEIREYGEKFGYRLKEDEIEAYVEFFKGCPEVYQKIYDIPELTLPVKYPRLPGYKPTTEEDPLKAWAWKCEIEGAKSGLLAGKRVAIKDNVSVASIPMMNGSRYLEGFIPEQDATIVSRILDAGGKIVGKANCQDHCLSGGSWLCADGPTRNPVDPSRSAGGSSSGSAVVIAAGEADMATGGDQGGSVRIPASNCGIVGLKPTFGLVPYTGIIPISTSIDHAGPMARTVKDVALLLEVMAGYDDGRDCRQPDTGVDVPKYSELVNKSVAGTGLKLAVIAEGYTACEEGVIQTVKRAVDQIKASGKFAAVDEISAPFHLLGKEALFGAGYYGFGLQCIGGSGFGLGGSGMQPSRLSDALWRGAQAAPHTASHTVKAFRIVAEFLRDRHGFSPCHRSQTLGYDCRVKYDKLLEDYDALLMPTLTRTAAKIPDKDAPLLHVMEVACDMIANTCPFDISHHPALSLNAGFSDENNMPVGLQIVGKRWKDASVLQIGNAIEEILMPLQSRKT